MIARSAAARAAASVVLAGALLVGTAGCTFVSTQATLIEYDPSDGVSANVGDVQVRNTIVLLGEEGDVASLLVTIINSGDTAANVKLQYEAAGEKVTVTKTVGANDVASFGNTPTESQILIEGTGAKAGSLLPIYVQYGDHTGEQMLVPVLVAGEGEGEYSTLPPVLPTETATPTATPKPTDEPSDESTDEPDPESTDAP